MMDVHSFDDAGNDGPDEAIPPPQSRILNAATTQQQWVLTLPTKTRRRRANHLVCPLETI